MLDLIPQGAPSDIVRDVYFGLAAEGRLNAHVHDGFWWEFGSPREYLEGSMRLVGLPSEKRLGLGDFDAVRPVGGAIASVGAGADCSAPGIQLAGTLAIGMGVMIGEGPPWRTRSSCRSAWIRPRSNLRRCIVAPGTEIPLEFSASDALLAADVDRDSAPERGIEQVSGAPDTTFLERSRVMNALRPELRAVPGRPLPRGAARDACRRRVRTALPSVVSPGWHARAS